MRTIEMRDATYDALNARAALSGLVAQSLVDELVRSDIFEHSAIVRTPDVCDGVACLVGTRTPVWLVEQYRRAQGDSSLSERFPHLASELPSAAAVYAESHKQEIEMSLAEQNLI